MSAPLGNNFWELRSSHGRDTLFESSALLWEESCKYFQWCIDNPLMEVQQCRSSGGKPYVNTESGEVTFPPNTTELPKMRAFTMAGLCRFLSCNTAYFKNFKSQERAKKEDFMEVITRIEETIYEQKFVGAAAGFLNYNIIARGLGLIERRENNIDFNKLSDEQLDEIVDRLKGGSK